MSIHARYAHTSIAARDRRRLVDFYVQVFGCVPVGQERRYRGQWIEDATGVAGLMVEVTHLRLPGHGDMGPNLEIAQYSPMEDAGHGAVNRRGLTHLVFSVPDLAMAHDRVLAHGGEVVGSVQSQEIPGLGRITLQFVADPEGNLIELQHRAH